MIEEQRTWADVWVGAYVRDKNGNVWRVVSVDEDAGGLVQAVDRQGRKAVIAGCSPDTPVTMLGTSEQEALEVVRSTLGAQPIAYRNTGSTDWIAPARLDKTHLEVMHRIYTGKIEDLDAFHTADHARPTVAVPHLHRPPVV